MPVSPGPSRSDRPLVSVVTCGFGLVRSCWTFFAELKPLGPKGRAGSNPAPGTTVDPRLRETVCRLRTVAVTSGRSACREEIFDESSFVVAVEVVSGEQCGVDEGDDAAAVVGGPVGVQPRLYLGPAPQGRPG